MPRLARPLNPGAVRQADEQIYARHAGDPRPNALYDAEGLRRPLDGVDPSQAALRSEWVALYQQSLPTQPGPPPPPPPEEPPAPSERPPSSNTETCTRLHWIQIQLKRKQDAGRRPIYWPNGGTLPYPGEPYDGRFTSGQEADSLDGQGTVRRNDIPSGACGIRFPEFYNEVEQYFREQLS